VQSRLALEAPPAELAPMVKRGAPRIRSRRVGRKSYGPAAARLAKSAGLELFGYQRDALRDLMSVDEDGLWLHFEGALNMARQNGKGAILEALELWHLFEGGTALSIHSAHEFKTSELHMQRLENLIRNTPKLSERVASIKHSHGQEGIYLLDGRSLRFYTRTRSGTRGFSAGLVVLDEAMEITEAAHGSMMPTLRAQTRDKAPAGPMLVYAGSAVDELVHSHGLVFTRIRERGLAGDDPSLCYLEWSVAADHPLDVTDAMANDLELWRQANPGLGQLIAVEHMARELRSMERRTFAVELLGVGAYPDTEGVGATLIGIEDWLTLADADATMSDPVVLAFDVSPSRRSSISAVGLDDSGAGYLLEVVDSREGTSWVPRRLEELNERHDVAEFVCDGYGPAVSIANQIEELGLEVRRLDSGEHGQACGRLVDSVADGSLRHLGQDELTLAIKGAKPRPLGDAWAFSRRNSSVDISPLVAGSFALWSALELDLAAGPKGAYVY
jgi:hypothetical protein